MIRERDASLDFIKGICILIVVLCHCVPYEMFPAFISDTFEACFLRSFFCVSGYLYYTKRKNPLNDTLKSKFLSLIIPYIFFSIFAIIWHAVLTFGFGCREISDSYYGINLLYRDIFCAVSGIGIGTLWFLPVLFLTYAIMSIYIKYIHNKLKLIYAVAIWVIVFIALNFIGDYLKNISEQIEGNYSILSKYVFLVYRVMYGSAFALAGFYIRILKEKNICMLPVGLSFLCLSIFAHIFDKIVCFNIFTCLCTVILILWGFKKFKSLNQSKIIKPIIYCGKNSLSIMIYHYIFLLPIEQMILNKIYLFSSLHTYIQGWLLFALNIITTIIMTCFLNKFDIFNFFMGKSGKYKEILQNKLFKEKVS